MGEPGEKVVGTDGPDVIVSNGAHAVDGKDGDDLICMTEQGREKTYALGRDGNDRIVITGGQFTHVYPGSGDDTVTGGPGREKVYLGIEDVSSPEPGVDTIRTAGGRDLLVAYHHEVIDARIELGSGDDSVRLPNGNRFAPEAVLDGGKGSDYLAITGDEGIQGDAILLDNELQHTSVDGEVTQQWADFEGFNVANTGFASVDFVGSSTGEVLFVEPLEASVRADMGAGNDQVWVDGPSTEGTTVDGRKGHDQLTLSYYGEVKVTLDVRLGTAVTPAEDQGGAAFDGLEQYYVSAGRVTMLGDRGVNVLAAAATGVVLRGGAGNDALSCWNDAAHGRGCGRTVIEGDRGDDDLIGGIGDDLIKGGPGRDRANGRKGTDRCIAVEDRRECERS